MSNTISRHIHIEYGIKAVVANSLYGEDRSLREILKQPDPMVNLWPLFGHPADPTLVLWDGVHPSIEGHMLIVETLVSQLEQAW